MVSTLTAIKSALIVDDDPDSRELLKLMLEVQGISSWTTDSATEAQAFAAKARPSLILTDLWMRPVDGWTLTRALRASPQTREIPIIVTSGAVLGGERDIALLEDCHGFLSKPLDPGTFVEAVKSAIKPGRGTIKTRGRIDWWRQK